MDDKLIKKELAILPHTDADEIEAVFSKMADELRTYDKAIAAVYAAEPSKENCADAKKLRLAISKVRTAADKVRKEKKQVYDNASKAIQAVYNIFKNAAAGREQELKEREEFFARAEAVRIAELAQARAAQLEEFGSGVAHMQDLGNLSAEAWDNYYSGAKLHYETKQAAEKKAEEERLAHEMLVLEMDERKNTLAPFAQFGALQEITMGMSEDAFLELHSRMKVLKHADEVRLKELELKNARLEKEAEEKEAERLRTQAEVEKKEAAARAEREKEAAEAAAKLAAEREERRRIEAEQATKLAKLESEKRRAEEARRQAAADQAEQLRREVEAKRKADNAPDKEKLQKYTAYLRSKVNEFKTTEGKAALKRIADFSDGLISQL